MPRSAKHAAAFLSTFALPADAHRTAVVVGGTTGIGRAVAAELAARGVARVLVAGRNTSRGAATCEALRGAAPGVRAEFLACDVMCVRR
jgi:NAD(P)-dependent dehydrogenase (short-subunit alcohol dehydrogenase family)